jgi:hypothetical protein
VEFVPMLALAALIYKLVDFVRYLLNGDRNGAITQLVTWAFAILAVILYAHTNWAHALSFGGINLHQLNLASQLVVGLQLGSLASTGKDLLKAVDNTNSAKIPTLLPAGPAALHRRQTQDAG